MEGNLVGRTFLSSYSHDYITECSTSPVKLRDYNFIECSNCEKGDMKEYQLSFSLESGTRYELRRDGFVKY